MKLARLRAMIVQVAILVLKPKMPQFFAILQNTVLFVLVFAPRAPQATGRHLIVHHCTLCHVVINSIWVEIIAR